MKNNQKKSIAGNVIYNFIYQILTILLPLITTPYLSRVLGSEPIGIYGYTISIATYFMLFGSLGISMYGQREIAKYQNNKKEYSKNFFEIINIRFLAILLSLLIFFVTFCLTNEYSFYYKILSLYIVSAAFDINWFFQGIEDFSKTVIRNIIVKILSIILIFKFVTSPNDLWIYILIFVGAELLGNLSLWLYLPKFLVKVDFKRLSYRKHLKPVLLLLVPQIATQIYTVLDKTMVGVITNDMNEVGFYEQSQKIARADLVIVAAVQAVVNSKVANAYYRKSKGEIVDNMKKAFDYVWFLGIPLTLGLIAVSSNLVPWYYGPEFLRVDSILKAIAPIILVIGLNGITGIVYLIQTGKQGIYTKSVIFGAIVNFIMNLIFIWKFGGVGAAIASVIAEVSILVYHLKYVKEIYSLSSIFKASIKCIFAGIIMFGCLIAIKNMFLPSILNTLFLVIIGTFIYVILLLIFKYEFLYKLINQGVIMVKNFLKRG